MGCTAQKRCLSFPTLKVRHGISSYIVPKILSCFHPLARQSLPQVRIQRHKGSNAVFSYVRDGGAVWSGMRCPLREYNITSASLDTLTSHESRPRQDIHPNSINLLSPNGLLTHRLNRCVIDLCPKRTVSLLLASSAFVKLHLPLADLTQATLMPSLSRKRNAVIGAGLSQRSDSNEFPYIVFQFLLPAGLAFVSKRESLATTITLMS